jgi:nucleoside-diphosphate-sugar epimerase
MMRTSLSPWWVLLTLAVAAPSAWGFLPATQSTRHDGVHNLASSAKSTTSGTERPSQGKILVLGGTGFLGQAVCKRAIAQGFQVTSLSRRGLPPISGSDPEQSLLDVDYRQGDARKKESIANILQEGGYTAVVHCVGLLLDEESGLSTLNKFASGSGSEPDAESTYDKITRLTAFNAIDASLEYAADDNNDFAFCFTSAAEAGWPDVPLGNVVEGAAPDFLKRYLAAKRAVEAKLLESAPTLRPIIVRPSLIYSADRPLSFLSVGAFFVGNAVGLPFMDRPVTVQALAAAIVNSIAGNTSGVLRYMDIESIAMIDTS